MPRCTIVYHRLLPGKRRKALNGLGRVSSSTWISAVSILQFKATKRIQPSAQIHPAGRAKNTKAWTDPSLFHLSRCYPVATLCSLLVFRVARGDLPHVPRDSHCTLHNATKCQRVAAYCSNEFLSGPMCRALVLPSSSSRAVAVRIARDRQKPTCKGSGPLHGVNPAQSYVAPITFLTHHAAKS